MANSSNVPCIRKERGDMGFVVDAPGNREEVAEAFSDHLVRCVTAPVQEGPVYMSIRPLGSSEMYPHGALSIMSWKSRRWTLHGRVHTKVRIAEMTSSGALRFGQWPVACRTIIRLFGMARLTKSPTSWEAMMSSLHCRTSVGTVTSGEILPVVRGEGHAGEGLGDLRDPCGRSCWSVPRRVRAGPDCP